MKRVGKAARAAASVAAFLMLLLGAPATWWFKGDKDAALAIAGIAAVAFLLIRIDEIAEVSLGPFKARFREAIAEANATILQLRSVAVETARSSLAILMADRFMDGMAKGQWFSLHDRLLSLLKDIGASEEQIRYATEEWRRGIPIIYHRIIRNEMENVCPKEKRNVLSADFQELLDFPNWTTTSPDKMEAFAKKHDLLTTEVAAWIEDYRHFMKTGEIRRREDFEDR